MAEHCYRNLILLVITSSVLKENFMTINCVQATEESMFETHPYDGFFNNLLHPDWGAVDGQLLRKSPAAYSDGVYQPSGGSRPNPFVVSRAAHHGQAGLGSLRGRTAFMVYFGQQVVEEIMDAQRPGCPREFFNIPIDHAVTPHLDPENKEDFAMPFIRSRFDQNTGYSPGNPRQQLNENTPYIDGSLFYGPAKAWTDAIRELSETYKGRLKAIDPAAPINESFPAVNDIRLPFANPPPPREHELKPVARFWRIGNPRGNENPFLLAFGLLFFRYHNYVADTYARNYPALNDEQVFNLARKKVIAVHQKIVLYDWLPAWLEIREDGTQFSIPAYDLNDPNNRYDPNIHPGITHEFQTAALRFGHTLVTPGTWLRNKAGVFQPLNVNVPGQPDRAHAVRLCNAFWNPQEFLTSSSDAFDNMLLGLSSTLSEREDNIVVPDLREHLFGPLDFSRRDLMAINLQRGRDHGLSDYNTIRETFGLTKRATWEDINNYTIADISGTGTTYTGGCYMCQAIQATKAVYGTDTPDNLDLFTGGILESTPNGPGELFQAIMLEQFLRIRNGDRFWFENVKNGLFNSSEIEEIRNTSILDIIVQVTNIDSSDINVNPFIFNQSTDSKFSQPSQLVADSDKTYNNAGTTYIILENCTTVQYYDYFSGSEYSFALSFTALGLCIPGTIGIMVLMVKYRRKQMEKARRAQAHRKKEDDPNTHHVIEIVGPRDGERNVKVNMDDSRKKIHVTDTGRKSLRMIDLRHINKIHIRLSTDKHETLVSIRVPGDIDLVLRFSDKAGREEFLSATDRYLQKISVRRDKHEMTESMILKDATTKEQRKKVLDKFICVVCMQAFKKNQDELQMGKLDAETANEVSKVQLTKTEFAESLGLKPTSVFVRNMFRLVDKDKNGFVNFQEFMNMFMILSKGKAGDKAQLLFSMYDIRGRGELSAAAFAKMIQSMLDLSDTKLDQDDLQALVGILYSQAGLRDGQSMSLDQFKKIFASDEYEKTLANASLLLQGAKSQWQQKSLSFAEKRKTYIGTFEESYRLSGPFDNAGEGGLKRRKTLIRLNTKQKPQPKTGLLKRYLEITGYFENHRRQIFWATLYVLVTIGIFLERAHYYSFEREHVGLRRLAGYGVSITRGAASGMMWTYSCLLITMSRNVITFLRETFLHRFIPFDSFHDLHKFIAAIALFFTVMHVVGHGINLYHISTWASSDLNCVFREYFRATNVLASFHYWAWTTITGLTGILLTLVVIVMYVFAMSYARRNLFKAFWFTHGLYVLLYILLIMHGSGRLVQAPLTQNFLYGPLAVFIFDKLISVSRKKVKLTVMKAELLPSDVLGLTFKRPPNFDYKSGQWVRIACLELGSNEYHPFTLTSAPHEEHLSLHIRAVGPWTMNMRKTYDINNRNGKAFPKVKIEGPFGEGHQDWYKYKVAVLVGGGIGVTPFASILKDIVNRSRSPGAEFVCQKVYFLWITRTQKQFEWLTDILREVEHNDDEELVDVHIFITQFQQKFDLRTTMLYICERHFQKICGKSLFTGLKATTHFGRPQLEDFLNSIHFEHPKVKQVGVFSCGPPPMTLSVDKACTAMNKYQNYPTYLHHFENF